MQVASTQRWVIENLRSKALSAPDRPPACGLPASRVIHVPRITAPKEHSMYTANSCLTRVLYKSPSAAGLHRREAEWRCCRVPRDVAPAFPYVPTEHIVPEQSVWPEFELYCPGEHCPHADVPCDGLESDSVLCLSYLASLTWLTSFH